MPADPSEAAGGPESRRWLLFFLRPADLLRLFQILASEEKPELHASHFPPDTRIVDAFYDGERDCFALMIASEFFEPVRVSRTQDGGLSAAWNQLFFDLNEVHDASDAPSDLWSEVPADDPRGRAPGADASPTAPRIPLEGEKRWCAFFVKPAQILWLLGVLASRRAYQVRAFPPDARLVFGTWDEARRAFGLIVSSEDFDPVQIEPATDEGGPRLALPERSLSIAATDDGPPPPPD